jgi:putative membrane protein
MIGSLNKIWPWKEAISTRINSHGEEVAVQFNNMMPSDYTSLYGIDSAWGYALLFALIGFAIVFLLEMISNKLQTKNE